MIKVSKLTDYAIVILSCFSLSDEKLLSAAYLSVKSGLPEPTVAKVLKLLAKGGIVQSVRGAAGGYKMARGSEEISMADIIQTIDGPIALTACIEDSTDTCAYRSCCPVEGRWGGVNLAVKAALDSVRLSDMISAETAVLVREHTEKGGYEHL